MQNQDPPNSLHSKPNVVSTQIVRSGFYTNRRTAQAGFTLVELLTAVAVGAIIISAAYGLFVNAFKQNIQQRSVREVQQTVEFVTSRIRAHVLSAAGGLPEDVAGIFPDSTGNGITLFKSIDGIGAEVLDALNNDTTDGVLPVDPATVGAFDGVAYVWVEGGVDSVAKVNAVDTTGKTVTVDSLFDIAGATKLFPLTIHRIFLHADSLLVSNEWSPGQNGDLLALGVDEFNVSYDTTAAGNATSFSKSFPWGLKPSRVRVEVTAGDSVSGDRYIERALNTTIGIRRGRI
ncbi:MAG: prepilin-type N-terminal cleavage/methylation domain-containing protein [Chitinivibrionales bacterium]|nr:prepilin-type N-terminal cleavage/methylation domain-containing protein [Chitinivibrionales bacterium]